MSLKSVSNPEKNVAQLEFTIDKPAFDEAVNKAYCKTSNMNVLDSVWRREATY